jgi:ABC-type proline/glycine betaine transport system permease subunit
VEAGVGQSRTERIAIAVAGVVAVLLTLPPLALLIFTVNLTPVPGSQLPLRATGLMGLVGWGALVVWLLVDLVRLRLRLLVPAVATWIWAPAVFVVARIFGGIDFGP